MTRCSQSLEGASIARLTGEPTSRLNLHFPLPGPLTRKPPPPLSPPFCRWLPEINISHDRYWAYTMVHGAFTSPEQGGLGDGRHTAGSLSAAPSFSVKIALRSWGGLASVKTLRRLVNTMLGWRLEEASASRMRTQPEIWALQPCGRVRGAGGRCAPQRLREMLVELD